MYLSIDRLITSEKLAPAPGLTAGHQPADILANISVVPELTPGSVRTINFTGKRLHHELITRRTINTAKQKALFRCEKITTNQVLINLLLHIFCIKAKKCPSLSFLTEAQPRLNKRGQKALFWQRPTDGATVSVRKSAAEKELLFVRLVVGFVCVGGSPPRRSRSGARTLPASSSRLMTRLGDKYFIRDPIVVPPPGSLRRAVVLDLLCRTRSLLRRPLLHKLYCRFILDCRSDTNLCVGRLMASEAAVFLIYGYDSGRKFVPTRIARKSKCLFVNTSFLIAIVRQNTSIASHPRRCAFLRVQQRPADCSLRDALRSSEFLEFFPNLSQNTCIMRIGDLISLIVSSISMRPTPGRHKQFGMALAHVYTWPGSSGNFVPVQLTWSCLHWRAVFGRPRPPAGHVVVARLPQWPSQRSPNNRTYCVCRDDDLQNCFKFIAGCECLAQREPRQGNLKEDVVCVVIGCWLMSPSSSPATSPTMSNSSSPTPPAVSYNKITGIPCVAAASRYTAPVHIDVGGTIYTSSLETLTK
ncbi:hypothetical protein GEV33_014626 [Tenebrio molitor]|uniref:Uncharacterized protein n=1 Tax=Tenebrio molitor TaxID=7067 RepID=A0A8J6GXY2_TENMO|nr:hypothetical protein GEV33_014626 [Tenebrio molitor]